MGFDKKIEKYVDKSILDQISTATTAKSAKELTSSANKIAKAFGAVSPLFGKEQPDFETKLISSFQKNLSLLIQKTWVEKADAELKDNVLYKLNEYGTHISSGSWQNAFPLFLQIIDDVVYLMFGQQTKSDDFIEYALRIDPEFGIFWLFIKNLPVENDWDNDKYRVLMLLGMYFLANY